jgi:hypothetical protein
VALGIGGFKIIGEAAGDLADTSVASAGDVNGDGFDDVIVGAPGRGAAYVVFGAASGITSVSLAELGSGGIKFIGVPRFTHNTGQSVDSAGDFNGDGFDDVIIADSALGYSYVVFGTDSQITSVNLGSVASDNAGLEIASRGASVSFAGDVNGDGFDDVFVGPYLSAAYVVFGRASGSTSITLEDLAIGIGGYKITGAIVSLSNAGDVNGDGFDDLIIGCSCDDDAGNNAGAAYVVLESASVSAVSQLSAVADDLLVQLDGSVALLGVNLSDSGDVLI